jgi:hypothetical protein
LTTTPLQLGSNTLGRVNDEDAEKGLVYWDVFKSARLDNLKERKLLEGGNLLYDVQQTFKQLLRLHLEAPFTFLCQI